MLGLPARWRAFRHGRAAAPVWCGALPTPPRTLASNSRDWPRNLSCGGGRGAAMRTGLGALGLCRGSAGWRPARACVGASVRTYEARGAPVRVPVCVTLSAEAWRQSCGTGRPTAAAHSSSPQQQQKAAEGSRRQQRAPRPRPKTHRQPPDTARVAACGHKQIQTKRRRGLVRRQWPPAAPCPAGSTAARPAAPGTGPQPRTTWRRPHRASVPPWLSPPGPPPGTERLSTGRDACV